MEKYELAEQDYIKGAKYREIADKYRVTVNTVKSWKQRYKWIRGPGNSRDAENGVHTKEKGVHTKAEPEFVCEDGLTDRQREFCIKFLKSHNATRSYQSVYGCAYTTAGKAAYELLKTPKIKNYIDDLRQKQLEMMMISKEDIIQKYVDIAYDDLFDYVDKDGNLIAKDGQNIQEIQVGPRGKKVKLLDKMKALEKLQQYLTEEEGTEGSEAAQVVIIERKKSDYMGAATETS